MNTALLETRTQQPPAVAEVQTARLDGVPPRKGTGFLAGEWRVVLCVLAVFFGLEMIFRVGGQKLSKDIEHLRSFPEIAATLAEFPADQGTRILFLGNSLTRYGVDVDQFAEVCRDQFQEPVQAVKMNPDNTALADWYYGYRRYFHRQQIRPDLVIIGFEGGHLRDAPSHHPDRLAQYYCDADDYPELTRFDLRGFEEHASYWLARASAAFGNRDRIQRRVLDDFIPDYRAGMDELNRRMNQQSQRKLSQPELTQSAAENEPDYSRLLEFVALAERDQVQVFLVAMPVPEAYEFDRGLLEVVQSTSAVLLDCRQVPGIEPAMFFDGLHMDDQAQTLYSRYLAEQCGPLLQTLQPLPVAEGNAPAAASGWKALLTSD